LHRNDHEREQQDQGRRVQGAPGFFQADRIARDEGDGPEQGDARPVQLQQRQAPQDHA
jgi:hypothetical protein